MSADSNSTNGSEPAAGVGTTRAQPGEPPKAPTVSANYSNLRFHASGGLGEVYRAHDESLRREVALKFTQVGNHSDPELLELFLLEAEVTSRLNHPGVVPVYGLGQSACGRPFYAMRFVEGTQFKTAIELYHKNGCKRLDLHHLLSHLVAVSNTVAYAHNRGIVHRDIKPENIMLGKYGETLLVDWGLALPVARDDRARASGEKTMLVQRGGSARDKSSGSGGGTIGYMSPEQLPDHPGRISPASDIYSLGATLYRLLTNTAPFQGQNETLLLDKVRWGDFPRPREVNPHVAKGLEAICVKAMAVNPNDRYLSALDMAADLEAWMADEVVSVYDEPVTELLFRWGRRHHHWVIAGVAGVGALVLVLFWSALNSRQIADLQTQARITAEESQKLAEEARAEAERSKLNGMRVAARFAAKAVANEIDLRWRILTQEATSPQLHELLLGVRDQPVGSPAQRAVQQWIEARPAIHAVEAESWFLTDHRGIQVAREPFSRKSIYENYSKRTYFHGGPRELTDEEMQTPVKPIDHANLSTVYLSTSSGTLKVSFSVPVWQDADPQSEFLGILGMSLELGAFRELQTGLNAGQIAVLIDTREDNVEDEAKSGLILHHRDLHRAQQMRLAAGDDSFPRISQERVEQLTRLRKLRAREAGLSAQPASENGTPVTAPMELAGSIDTNYSDPLAPIGSPTVTAAFEPVRVDSQAQDVGDTGWVVAVQDDPRAVVEDDAPQDPQ